MPSLAHFLRHASQTPLYQSSRESVPRGSTCRISSIASLTPDAHASGGGATERAATLSTNRHGWRQADTFHDRCSFRAGRSPTGRNR